MSRDLDRTITLRDLALLVVGNVIGSGIFIVPATVLAQVNGDVGTAQLVWLIGGVLSLLGALTYGELAAMKPEAGGLYVFARDAFGSFVAFLFGWTLFFAIGAGTVATLGAAFAGYLGQFVTLSVSAARIVAVLMVVVVATINVRSTRESTTVNNWTTAFKFGALVFMGLALFIGGDGLGDQGGSYLPRDLGVGNLPAVGLALIGVLWAFEGWQWVTFTAGETIDPGRTFPRGIAIGTIAIIAVYSLANIGYVAALGPDRAMATDSIASSAVETVFGGTAGRLIAAAILVSIFSAANATMLTASRVAFAMARDGLFFRRLGEVHPRLGTPALSIVALAAWSMVLAATGTFDQLLTYVIFTGWIFYGLGAAAIFVFRRREPDTPRPFRVPGYPVTPLLFVLSAAAIVANTLFGQPREAGIGLLVVFIGAPAYLVWRKGGARR
jgi:APA family basic amino acid/polyamine antiporter